MIEKWIIHEPKKIEPMGCVLALPGRGIPGQMMENFLGHSALNRSLQVVLEPENFQWYPAPNGANDQARAIGGLATAVNVIEAAVKKIEKGWGIKKDKIGIVGFSAGAVMAIQLLAHSSKPYAGILGLQGAILDPESLPKAKHKTPVMIQHNMDDECFSWGERYLPMKHALIRQDYNTKFVEGWAGGHNLSHEEVVLTRNFFGRIFGYLDELNTELAEREERERREQIEREEREAAEAEVDDDDFE